MITFRTIVEVLGKPKEHVENTFREYIEKLKADTKYKVIREDLAEVKQQEKTELWSTFVELEIKANTVQDIIHFCFDYMPSQIEIIEPQELTLSDVNMSAILSDLQGKLHNVDMVAKTVKMENDLLQRNMSLLLKNYILILLSRQNLTSEHLAKFTGVVKDKIEDFLDKLIDEKKIDLKEGVYFIVKDGTKS